ncbi:MAG: APC family permease, partial [Cyanobium sp.]
MSESSPQRLLSILGIGFGLAGAVGGTIGAGILRTPGVVAAELPTPSLVLGAWLAGGVYALLGAVCTA